MSNIEKIRQEIERRHDYENEMYHKTKPDGKPNDGWAESLAIMGVLEELLAFIDSLPEEKPTEDLEEAAKEYAYKGIPEELKSEVKPIADQIIKNFIAGAKWRANQLLKGSPLPEDTVLFQKGVEEGRRLEKDDLALTWENIANIDAIILDVNNEFAVDYSKEIDRQKFYEEVLKRFKETKK